MKIFVFKTNIDSHLEMSILASVFMNLKGIIRWSVDMHDVDRVLKIVTLEDCCEIEFMRLIRSRGIFCEALPD